MQQPQQPGQAANAAKAAAQANKRKAQPDTDNHNNNHNNTLTQPPSNPSSVPKRPTKRPRKAPSSSPSSSAAPSSSSPSSSSPSASSSPVSATTPLSQLLGPTLTHQGQLHALRSEVLGLVFPNRGRSHNHRFYTKLPGPQPASLSRALLQQLREREYWVCEKSDGERAMMFVRGGQCFLVNRRFDMRELVGEDARRVVGLLTGGDPSGVALLDGELVEAGSGTSENTYLIYDVLVALGQFVGEKKTTHRLGLIGQIVSAYRQMEAEHKPQSVVFQGKKFFDKREVYKVLGMISKAPGHGKYIYREVRGSPPRERWNYNDGLIFTPKDEPYLPAAMTLLKWKWLELNTVDFKVKRPFRFRNNKLRLFVGGENESDVWVRDIDIADSEWRPFHDRIVHQLRRDSAIIECGYNRDRGTWDLHLMREDKRRANFITTFTATLEAIADNVTPTDICKACEARKPCPPEWREA